MRILFSIESMGSGGKERRLSELIKHFLGQPGYVISLVLFHKGKHFHDIEDPRLQVHFLNKDTSSMLSLQPFRRFEAICREFKPDLIHSWGNLNSILAIPSSLYHKIPIINNQITSVAKSNRKLQKLFYYHVPFWFSRKIIGNSMVGLKSFSVNPSKARCIYNGFNPDRLHNLRPGNEVRKELGIKTPLVVGMVANSVPAKDYHTFLECALQILKTRDDVSFVAIGRSVRRNFEQYKQNDYASRILLFDSRQDVENDMNIFDIGVLSSFYEGLPNVVLEMMALGIPVIATNVGGTPELIDDGNDGYLFKTGDTEKLTQLINTLLDNDSLRKEMGEKARKKIRENFQVGNMLSAYEEVYREVLKTK